MEEFKNSKIGIVCNDAGGAQILSHWILNNFNNEYFFHLGKIAKEIFIENKISLKTFSLNDLIDKSDYVFTGTDYNSVKIIDTIKKCNKKNKKVYSFLDHWINYKFRFLSKSKELVLPYCIVVSDVFAKNLARKIFNCKIRLIENFFLKKAEQLKKKINNNNILYMSANSNMDYKKYHFNDDQILEKVLSKFDDKRYAGYNFIIRKHSSEKKSKYIKFLKKKLQFLSIKFDKKKKLTNSINNSRLVVGFDTYGLVVAKKMGRISINIKLNENYENIIPSKFTSKKIIL